MNIIASLIIFLSTTATTVRYHIERASGKRSDVYGKGELFCGDIGKPRACVKGAVTASGVMFDPNVPSIALSLPKRFKLRPTLVLVRSTRSECVFIWLLDKKHPRYAKDRPWDVSPAAAELLEFKGTRGKIFLCEEGEA